MSTKIVKAGGAQADEFELSVAQELLNLEVYTNYLLFDVRAITDSSHAM